MPPQSPAPPPPSDDVVFPLPPTKKPNASANLRMLTFLKNWRQEALTKHQWDAAIFVGDKVYALTGELKDAFWIAQVHISSGHFGRAYNFLLRNGLIDRSSNCRYLAALCLIKESKHEEALAVLGETNPTHLVRGARREPPAKPRSRSTGSKNSSGRDRDEHGSNIKFEAGMCHLRGQVYAKLNAFDKAKDCYKTAVLIDVRCFEAFDQLMRNSLMSPAEEWEFLDSLDFGGMDNEDLEAAEFAKMLYTTRLSKYKNPSSFNEATTTLAEQYNLGNNADLIISRAELLFTQCRFKQCLTLCENLLAEDNYNFSIYPLYLACLHELNMKNKLFLVAHDMSDHYPDEPVSWLAVGVYYLTIGKIAEARRYFSKASMMDPHFGPAWIGFAHTFAAEGEHDQAISAYSTAARLFQGTHLPPLFLGMQHLQLNNVTLADEYLGTAHALCTADPLLLNELGVVFYHKDALQDAVDLFKRALRIADDIDSDPKAWVATRANLGHAYRRLEQFDRALECFGEVTRGGDAKDANVHAAVGLCHLQAGRPWDAVVSLHEALAVAPQDPVASELLEKALAENAASGERLFMAPVVNAEGDVVSLDEAEVDALIDARRRGGRSRRAPEAPGRAGGAGRRKQLGDVTRDFGGMDVSDDDDAAL